MSKIRKILITSALPYANGDIHMGHLVEYIQSDIWSRFQKLKGHQCIFVCASDAHGTPIMIRARKENISPEELVSKVSAAQEQDFKSFDIDFDNFYSTHSSENQELTYKIFQSLKKSGYIYTKNIEQAYDNKEKMFLPDRFIKGTCPKCKKDDQYGDACENCGGTYNPNELINPTSILSKSKPIWKESEHYFFKLNEFSLYLETWMKKAKLHPNISNKLKEWFDSGLQDWDISRDAPYFGFNIPGTKDKYFYVWLDAPIGYLASFLNYCKSNPKIKYKDYWSTNNKSEVYHFIGKDIVYFHTLFWPAILEGAGLRAPTSVFAHGFLTINGKKMSKSRGTFIKAKTYAENLDPTYLRYYYAAKLNPTMEDIDLNFDDFVARVNSDLVGKLINIASRSCGFINKRFNGKLAKELDNEHQFNNFANSSEEIEKYYENREYSKAIKKIMSLADIANKYIDEKKPWIISKDTSREEELQVICTQSLNLFRSLIIFLTPVIPSVTRKVKLLFNEEEWLWSSAKTPLLNTKINKFKPLLNRIDTKDIEEIINKSKETNMNNDQIKSESKEITIDEFSKIDLRIAEIKEAELVEDADKLVRLTLDLDNNEKVVFAGIKEAYSIEELKGRLVVVVANLKPRKMRFGTSEGMILAAGPGEENIFLLSADNGAKPGMKIK